MPTRVYTPKSGTKYYKARASKAELDRLTIELNNRAIEIAQERDNQQLRAFYTTLELRKLPSHYK
jgi:hypothetical protein